MSKLILDHTPVVLDPHSIVVALAAPAQPHRTCHVTYATNSFHCMGAGGLCIEMSKIDIRAIRLTSVSWQLVVAEPATTSNQVKLDCNKPGLCGLLTVMRGLACLVRYWCLVLLKVTLFSSILTMLPSSYPEAAWSAALHCTSTFLLCSILLCLPQSYGMGSVHAALFYKWDLAMVSDVTCCEAWYILQLGTLWHTLSLTLVLCGSIMACLQVVH